MSLPRLVSLRSDGLLNIEPVPELNCLRKNNYCIFEFDLSSSYIDLPVYGDCMEIAVEYELDSANEFGLCVRRSLTEKSKRQLYMTPLVITYLLIETNLA